MSKSPETITTVESESLLAWILHSPTIYWRLGLCDRNYLMTLLMLDAGLRVGEVVQLMVSDLWFNGRPVETLVVRAEITKTKTERTIPMTERLKVAIEKVSKKMWRLDPGFLDHFAFPSYQLENHFTVRSVEIFIAYASHKAFGRAITPHTLRHTFATRLMQRTNIRIVQKLLGHKSIQSTQVYTHPNQDDLTNAIKAIQ